ncbi:MAG: ribosome biogenesis GTPase Der, partial [Gammaproteobacteria bacterium]|nr:ribosome biogenesis GTPase Der [Gammaproteobacteria bacterium]
MIPVIALVGRANVGKSTLFNQLTRSRDALVANFPGLTRDRKYGEGRLGERPFIAIDTGGITGEESGINSPMAEQSLAAIAEADTVFFMVDARAGLTAADEQLASYLRRSNKGFHLVVNKVDGVNEDVALSEFYALGTAEMHPIAASHGRGVKALLDSALSEFPQPEAPAEEDEYGNVRVAVIGRPNVGKSTLVNCMLGEDRVVVFEQPGTTRDSIYIDFERDEVAYTLIDTAGVRRRKNVKETVEKFSIVKTLKAIDDAHVVVLLMDAREGVVDQDLH